MRMRAGKAFCLLLLLCLGFAGCQSEREVGATQVTARIYIAEEVRERMSQLRVRTFGEQGGDFSARAERSYEAESLDAIVDIAFVPKDRADDGKIVVVADALDAEGKVLVEARGAFVFVLHQTRFFELWLYRCAGLALGTLCADEACADDGCLTCLNGICAQTPLFEKPELSTLDPAVLGDPDKLPPGYPDSVDAGARFDGGTIGDADEMDADSPAACANGAAPPCGVDEDGATSLSDAGLDAGRDAEPSDAGRFDASTDAGDAGPRDAALDTGTDAQEAPGRCAQASAWTSREAYGTIPPRARVLAQHMNSTGTLSQYLCRALAPDGVTLVPGKVSASASLSNRLDNGCYGTYFSASAWQSFGVTAAGASFQVLTPPSECQLDWVAMSAGQELPARALAIGNTGGATPAPIYACRISVQDAMTSGTHIGRVGNAVGDACHVQYYQQPPLERSQFELLVQTRP
jgi:hypothetical protein